MLDYQTILRGTQELDDLCRAEYSRAEYDYGIADLLNDPDEELAAARLRRLTGITLKMPFATPEPIGASFTSTGASRAWPWSEGMRDGLVQNKDHANFSILDALRQELPNLDGYSHWSATWRDLICEAENESGLFQVLVHWVDDKLHDRPTKDFAGYYAGETRYQLGSVADAAETVFNYATAPLLVSFIPVAGLVVPLTLIGIRFGLTRMLKAKMINEDDASN